MLTPLVLEPEWLSALATSPDWIPSPQPLLVIAPHPDDETLGAGGLIAAQRSLAHDVIVAAVTDGEKAFPNAQGLAQTRRQEQTQALAHLGVPNEKIVRLELPDGNVAAHEQELIERLTPLPRPGSHILAPWTGDFHPDHEACGRAARELARRTGATLSFYFFWTWHYGTPALLAPLRLRLFPLSPEQQRAKSSALACHRSQLGTEWGEPVLPETLLAPARRPFEVFSLPDHEQHG